MPPVGRAISQLQEKTGLHHGARIYSEVQGGWKAATPFHCRHCSGRGVLFPVVLPSFRGPNRFVPRCVGSVYTHRQLPHPGERHGGKEVREKDKQEGGCGTVFCERRQQQYFHMIHRRVLMCEHVCWLGCVRGTHVCNPEIVPPRVGSRREFLCAVVAVKRVLAGCILSWRVCGVKHSVNVSAKQFNKVHVCLRLLKNPGCLQRARLKCYCCCNSLQQ